MQLTFGSCPVITQVNPAAAAGSSQKDKKENSCRFQSTIKSFFLLPRYCLLILIHSYVHFLSLTAMNNYLLLYASHKMLRHIPTESPLFSYTSQWTHKLPDPIFIWSWNIQHRNKI